MLFAGEETSVKFRQNFAELDIIKLLTLEEFVDSELEQEQGVVEGLRVDHLLLPRAKSAIH